jgi:hypothetical protein
MTNAEDILSKYEKGRYDGEFPTISPEDWETLKESYPKDQVKEMLADLFMKYPLPYATDKYTIEDARDDYMKLKGIRYHELIKEGKWFQRQSRESKYPLTYDGKPIYFKRYNLGNLSSNFFQEKNRWSICSSGYPGPARTWRTRPFMISLMGAAYTLKLPQVGKKELRVMIGLRKYIASQHKPNVTKALTEFFGSEKLCDFSAGWGDRLSGACASETVTHYVGIDPRKENHPLYKQQAEFYQKHTTFFENPTKVDLHQSPAEDFDYSDYQDYFDFTSPPYFNVERYGDDDTQSWIRYESINAWNEYFLHKTLEKIIPTLKKGGKMAINIADVYTSEKGGGGKDWKEITQPMCEFLESKGLTYKGCIGMEMAKRPNSGGAGTVKQTEHNQNQYKEETLKNSEENQDKTFCEPIWIFEK